MEEDSLGVLQYVWHRSDRDDWVHATVYWRVGLERFGTGGVIVSGSPTEVKPNSYVVNPDGTASFNPHELIGNQTPGSDEPWWASNPQDEDEWR